MSLEGWRSLRFKRRHAFRTCERSSLPWRYGAVGEPDHSHSMLGLSQKPFLLGWLGMCLNQPCEHRWNVVRGWKRRSLSGFTVLYPEGTHSEDAGERRIGKAALGRRRSRDARRTMLGRNKRPNSTCCSTSLSYKPTEGHRSELNTSDGTKISYMLRNSEGRETYCYNNHKSNATDPMRNDFSLMKHFLLRVRCKLDETS